MAATARTKWSSAPRLDDDVVRSTREDLQKATRAATGAKGVKGAARGSVMDAGKRAGSRLAGRAGLAGAALNAGWSAGRAIDEATGVGKKVVEATGLGKLIDNVVNDPDERVKLAPRKEAAPAKAAAPAPAKKTAEPVPKPPVKPSAPARKTRAEATPISSVREGHNENIDDDTRKRAMASVGMKAGGSVRGNGCAQRGKTRGRFI